MNADEWRGGPAEKNLCAVCGHRVSTRADKADRRVEVAPGLWAHSWCQTPEAELLQRIFGQSAPKAVARESAKAAGSVVGHEISKGQRQWSCSCGIRAGDVDYGPDEHLRRAYIWG